MHSCTCVCEYKYNTRAIAVSAFVWVHKDNKDIHVYVCGFLLLFFSAIMSLTVLLPQAKEGRREGISFHLCIYYCICVRGCMFVCMFDGFLNLCLGLNVRQMFARHGFGTRTLYKTFWKTTSTTTAAAAARTDINVVCHYPCHI